MILICSCIDTSAENKQDQPGRRPRTFKDRWDGPLLEFRFLGIRKSAIGTKMYNKTLELWKVVATNHDPASLVV